MTALKEAIDAQAAEYVRENTQNVLTEEDQNVIRQFESAELFKNISKRKDLGTHLSDLYKTALAPKEKPDDFTDALGQCVLDNLGTAAYAVGFKASVDVLGIMVGEFFSSLFSKS